VTHRQLFKHVRSYFQLFRIVDGDKYDSLLDVLPLRFACLPNMGFDWRVRARRFPMVCSGCVMVLWFPQADDPRVAASLLQKHDALVASGQQPHRVTQHFCAEADGSLRSDMEKHIAGGGMSGQLRSEILSYQVAKIDDTWAEAAHRDVSSYIKRTTSSRVAHTAASQRLAQNLASVDASVGAELELYYNCIRNHKAVGQLVPRRASELKSVKKKAVVVQSHVYRTDLSSLRDWGAELGLLNIASARPAQRRAITSRLQIEYLVSAVAEGKVLSLQKVSDETATEIGEAASMDRPALCELPASSLQFFTVCDRFAKRKKQLRTAAQDQSDMAMPVSWQRMTLWPACQGQKR